MKSYLAGTVEAAMALARHELGPEAMIVSSRRSTPEARHLGEYEVVFAAGTAPDTPACEGVRDSGEKLSPTVERLVRQIGDLRREVERMSTTFTRARFPVNQYGALPDGGARILGRLLEAGIDEEIGRDIVSRLPESDAEQFLATVMEDLVRCDASLGRPGVRRRIIAFVGPPGAGKTSTLVKVAARYGAGCRRPVHIISADSIRIGAPDQLSAYAAILGMSFQSVETPFALSLALDEHGSRDFVLIDTPGLSEAMLEDARGLSSVLATHPEVDVHLTVPASMRASDLTRTICRFAPFAPNKLTFTKIDETRAPGVVINEAIRSGLPIAFITNGQRVPEDFEEADASMLARFVQQDVEPAAATAAT